MIYSEAKPEIGAGRIRIGQSKSRFTEFVKEGNVPEYSIVSEKPNVTIVKYSGGLLTVESKNDKIIKILNISKVRPDKEFDTCQKYFMHLSGEFSSEFEDPIVLYTQRNFWKHNSGSILELSQVEENGICTQYERALAKTLVAETIESIEKLDENFLFCKKAKNKYDRCNWATAKKLLLN